LVVKSTIGIDEIAFVGLVIATLIALNFFFNREILLNGVVGKLRKGELTEDACFLDGVATDIALVEPFISIIFPIVEFKNAFFDEYFGTFNLTWMV
jgi:hypothetical protein